MLRWLPNQCMILSTDLDHTLAPTANLLSPTKNSQMRPMNAEHRRIEIFQPFGDAFEWMKRVLFRPFDLKKWLVLGFAAFIGGNWGGFGVGNFNPDAFKNATRR